MAGLNPWDWKQVFFSSVSVLFMNILHYFDDTISTWSQIFVLKHAKKCIVLVQFDWIHPWNPTKYCLVPLPKLSRHDSTYSYQPVVLKMMTHASIWSVVADMKQLILHHIWIHFLQLCWLWVAVENQRSADAWIFTHCFQAVFLMCSDQFVFAWMALSLCSTTRLLGVIISFLWPHQAIWNSRLHCSWMDDNLQ